MMYGWGNGWMMVLGGLLILLFWGIVIALAIWGIRAITRSGKEGGPSYHPQENAAIEILKQRYARGEITREEYLALRRDLES